MQSKGKKKPYSPPTLTKFTPEQAWRRVADRKQCSEEEAADLFQSLQKQPPNDVRDQRKRRLA
jgi:hypothetical protein